MGFNINVIFLVTACLLLFTVLASVPAILDRVYKSVWDKIRNGSSLKRVVFTFAISYKRKWLYRGANTPLINTFIMSSIRYILGGKIRTVISGGAPLNPKTQEFLRLALCCPIQQGYGLTETTSCGALSDQDDLSSGHVGAPLACTHIKLVDWEEGGYTVADTPGPRGEIWIGGENLLLLHGSTYVNNYNFTKRLNFCFFQNPSIQHIIGSFLPCSHHLTWWSLVITIMDF